MKTRIIVAAIALSLFALSTKAQPAGPWYVTGNAGGPANVFGTTGNFSIPFQTNGYVRVKINNGNNLPADGRIGIGNNLGAGFVPSARVHIHESGFLLNQPNPYLRFTTASTGFNPGTGATATDGYEMGIGLSGDAHIINHETDQPISIHTNDGGNGTLFHRMIISAENNSGNIGMGDNLPANFPPQNRLQLHHVNPTNVFAQFTNSTTGAASSDGLIVGTGSYGSISNGVGGFNPGTNDAHVQNLEATPMHIGVYVPSSGTGTNTISGESQDIFIDNLDVAPQILPDGVDGMEGGHWIGFGRVFQSSTGATPQFAPKAHLHVHGGNKTNAYGFGLGLRPWMQTGTLYTENTDGMYVGMRNVGNVITNPNGAANQNYAVINWSDDDYGAGGSDYLSFNFTSYGVPANLATSIDGEEVARLDPGNRNTAKGGTFGIGNFMSIGAFTQPVRRLEILDAEPITGTHFVNTSGSQVGGNFLNGAPQLRLTYNYSDVAFPSVVNVNSVVTATTTGTFSDFQTTQYGDLGITTYDYTQPHPVATSTLNLTQRFTGINTNVPGNSLEINSQFMPGTAYATSAIVPNGQPVAVGFGTPTGWAGLRFTDLNSTSTVQGNPGTGVLSVNSSGDVIYVPGGSGGGPATMLADNGCSLNGPTAGQVHLGNSLGNTQASLLDDRQVPMGNGTANYSVIFSDGNTAPGAPGNATPNASGNTFNIGFGFNPFPNGQSEFFTGNQNYGVGGVFATVLNAPTSVKFPASSFNNGSANLSGVGATGATGYVQIPSTSADNPITGVYGFANYGNITTNSNVFILPRPNVVGVRGEAISINRATGVLGLAAYSNTENVGGAFYASNASINNYALYATVLNQTGLYNYAGFFDGDVRVNGTYWQGSSIFTSDSTLKTNITPISSAISTIKGLKPKSFYFDTLNTHGLNFPSSKQYGFLAQNVKTILPELVSMVGNPSDTVHPGSTVSTLNYNAFIGLLTAGMQEQQQSIDSLRSAVGSGGGGGVSACSGILPNHITKWSSAGNICNAQITDDGYNVGIGGTVGTVMFNVLNNDVSNFGRNRAVQFYSSLPGNSLNNFGSVILSEGSTNDNIGMQIEARNISGYVAQNNWGIQSYASGASQRNFAGLFVADQPNVTPGSASYGIYAQTTGFADINYGVYAKASQAATCWAGYFDGNVNVNGSYFQNGSSFTSDRNLKTNIDSITNASGIIRQLKPSSFYFDTTNTLGLSFSGKKQYGLIAQDVQTVLPELVSTFNKPADVDTGGNVLHAATSYKTLNYNAFIAILIKSNQEQQTRLDRQDSIINALASQVNGCCNSNTRTTQNNIGKNTNNIDVELNNADIIVLNQNTPNPFAEQTFISYNIPQNIAAAQILFYDINGRNIKTVDITKKGAGQLNVYANDLTNGVYSYTLIADGKIIDTKKMVKQQ